MPQGAHNRTPSGIRGTVTFALVATLAAFLAAAGAAGTPPDGPQDPAATAPSVEVTAIANVGFLVRSARHAVLVDALFRATAAYPEFFQQAPSEALLERMSAGAEPFGQVDVALVTHADHDHFDPAVAATFLHHHPETVLVGTEEVRAALERGGGAAALADRVLAPSLDWGACTSLEVRGVPLTICRTLHSGAAERQNNVYVVDLDGFRFVHEGDANRTLETFQGLRLPENGVDLAFVHDWFLFAPEGREILAVLRPRAAVPMHLRWENVADARHRVEALRPGDAAAQPAVTFLDTELAGARFAAGR